MLWRFPVPELWARKEKPFGSSLAVFGREAGGAKAEGTLMGKA